ncbi:MAG: low molecular weight phosphotyrosine protein phosphatase [Acidimicrobiales bacterium]
MVTGGPGEVVALAAVCTGNICRSAMAEVAWRDVFERDELLRRRVVVSSAGTARWDVGQAMDPRARRALDAAGLSAPGTLAAFADGAYVDRQDLIVVMTREQRQDVVARASRDVEVILVRDLAGDAPGLDLADPYYGSADDFDSCLEVIQRAGRRLTEVLRQRPGAGSPGA